MIALNDSGPPRPLQPTRCCPLCKSTSIEELTVNGAWCRGCRNRLKWTANGLAPWLDLSRIKTTHAPWKGR